MENLKEFRLLYLKNSIVNDNGTMFSESLEKLREDFPSDDWAIIPVDEVPDNWHEETIENGKLADIAPSALEDHLKRVKTLREEEIKARRAGAYATESDPLFIAWQKYVHYGDTAKADQAKTLWESKIAEIKERYKGNP